MPKLKYFDFFRSLLSGNWPVIQGLSLIERQRFAPPSRNIDQFVAGHLALLHEIHHGQQQLPALGEKLASFFSSAFPCLSIV